MSYGRNRGSSKKSRIEREEDLPKYHRSRVKRTESLRGILPTKRELQWVGAYEGNGLEAAAAIGIGLTGTKERTPERIRQAQSMFAYQCMCKPKIVELIEQKMKAMAERAGRDLGKKLGKDELTQEILTLARLSPEKTKGNIQGQARCYELLCKLGGLIVEKVADVTERVRGKSPEEQDFIGVFSRDPYSQAELDAFTEKRRKFFAEATSGAVN